MAKVATPKGIRCRACGCAHFYTVRTRPATRGRIMRQKECRNCGRGSITYESSAGAAVEDTGWVNDLTPLQRETLIEKLIAFVGLAR